MIKETGQIPPELKELMQHANDTIKAWLNEQERRYSSVKEATEEYMKSRGKILPPEFKDFWGWYVDHCAEDNSDFFRIIQDEDFIKYHKYRDAKLSTPSPKPKKPYSVRAGGIALIFAYEAGKIKDELWHSNDLKEFAKNLFNIKNGHKTVRAAKDNYKKLEEVKNNYPVDYKLGGDLFKKHF